jgi:large subunit ribosomal protein L19
MCASYLPRHSRREEEIVMSSSPIITRLLAKAQRTDLPSFQVGDTIKVHVKIKEGDKERIQIFEGIVIASSRALRFAR